MEKEGNDEGIYYNNTDNDDNDNGKDYNADDSEDNNKNDHNDDDNNYNDGNINVTIMMATKWCYCWRHSWQ